MKKLIKLLRLAHSIEIGAYNAYEGHWRNIKPLTNPERGRVKWIQVEELLHKEGVYEMLQSLGAQPNYFQDALLYVIGRTISAGCYVFGYRASMWGAKIMEILGSGIYHKLAKTALECDRLYMSIKLSDMARAEEAHEEFFKTCLAPSKESGQQSRS